MLTDTVDIDAWIVGSATSEQNGRYNTQYKTSGAFDATLARGAAQLTATTTTGGTIAVGDVIEGAGIPSGATILSFDNNAHTINMSQNANGNGATTGSALRWRRPSTGAQGTLSISTAYARTGTRSLKLLKAGVGNGTNLRLYMAYPAVEGRGSGLEFYLKAPANGGALFNMYLDVYFANLARDGSIPRITKLLIISSRIIPIDLTAGVDWTRFQASTLRVDASTQHRGFAPAWATDILMDFNLASAPSNTAIHFANIQANNL